MAVLIKFEDFITFPLNCLKFIGLVESEKKMTKFSRAYFFATVINMTITGFMALIYIKNTFRDLPRITENVPNSGYTSLAAVKVMSLFLCRKEFRDLLVTLRDLLPRTEEDQTKFNVRKHLQHYIRIKLVLALMISLVFVAFILLPILKLIVTGVWIKKVPFETCFPFDAYDPPMIYNAVFIWEAIVMIQPSGYAGF